jgi:hypothetical protein
MKADFRCAVLRGCLAFSLVAALFVSSPSSSYGQLKQPVITSIRVQGTNLVVIASVPSGIQRVALEGRSRVGAGSWVPAAVALVAATGGTVTFTIPATQPSELLHVRADADLPLPARFYGGLNSFLGPDTNSVSRSVGLAPGGVAGIATGPTPQQNAPRTVVESDIWALSGDTLYFFNQYRGLQVIDISQPDSATVRGTLELPASGEQMYAVDSNHVVLLAASGCAYNTDQSEALVVAVSNSIPQVVTNLPITGWIQESRLVGTALYVASQFYRPVPGSTDGSWEWGTMVSSFDLANPDAPAVRSTLWYSGYGNVVTATDTYLFVVTEDLTNWWQSNVRIIDITAPDGTMAEYATLQTAGRVSDKFKLNYADDVLTSISEDWHWDNGTVLKTELETFDLPPPGLGGPGPILKLGELELGQGEQLHATRFDGNLVYVVTFFQVDPLWVVDLSEPANPHIAGSIQVPGWSSYLAPLGTRLVTVGVESNRVAVSLFDVHDPANPAALSQVLLGQNYSWSEANNDEKAFTVLPDIGLILVPYSGDTTNGWTSQVQLIDLTATNLVARGIINHQSQPRRATFSHNRILSLSGWELLSVDATDRDHPVVKGDTKLAWSADRLFVEGDFLLELTESTGWWGFQTPAAVRVTLADQVDKIIGELDLGDLPIVGAAVKGNRLYVAQSPACWFWLPLDGPGGVGCGGDTNQPNFFLSVIDLGALPGLTLLGQVSTNVDLPAWWGANWEAVWPQPDVLVWAGGGGFWWPFLGLGPASGVGLRPVGGAGIAWPFWGFGGGELLAFDVSNSSAPKFDSEVNLVTNGWWSFSEPFSSGTLVYLSHDSSQWVPVPWDPTGAWLQSSYLDVIDFADPVSPTLRGPVNIPGTLHGISHAGELLYTVGIHWTTNQVTDWTEWLDASAYDGVAAHLVDSLALPDAWPHPVLVVNTNVLLGHPGYNYVTTNLVAHRLEKWTLPDTGKFTLLDSATLNAPANDLLDRNGLLAVQETDGSLALFDDTQPGLASQVGQGSAPGCLWFDLSQSDGALGRGLWFPLGVYGVGMVPAGP